MFLQTPLRNVDNYFCLKLINKSTLSEKFEMKVVWLFLFYGCHVLVFCLINIFFVVYKIDEHLVWDSCRTGVTFSRYEPELQLESFCNYWTSDIRGNFKFIVRKKKTYRQPQNFHILCFYCKEAMKRNWTKLAARWVSRPVTCNNTEIACVNGEVLFNKQ